METTWGEANRKHQEADSMIGRCREVQFDSNNRRQSQPLPVESESTDYWRDEYMKLYRKIAKLHKELESGERARTWRSK
jgi:hypothetical protein